MSVIQKGGNKKTKNLYLGTLIGVIGVVVAVIVKYRKKIDWLIVLPYTWFAVIHSYLWQTLHNYNPADIVNNVAGWMFHENHLITKVLILGGVSEDILIFHPFGMLMGILLAIFVFKVFTPSKKENKILKIIVFSIIGLGLLTSAIFLDISSRYSFIIFALPGFCFLPFAFTHINLKRFLIWFPSMLAVTIGWEIICVVIPDSLYGHDGMCWFYKLIDGTHSVVYSNKLWLFNTMPFAIDVIYPSSGMIFLLGCCGFLMKLRRK